MTVALTAHLFDDNDDEWPYLTLSFFQQRALTTRELSGALLITFNPLVTSENRAGWEDYTFSGPDRSWHEEGLAYQKDLHYDRYGVSFDTSHVQQRTTEDSSLNISTGIANRIFTLDEHGHAMIDRSLGPYLPTWETSPVFLRTLVNRNILTDPAAANTANQSLSNGSVIFGDFEFAPDDHGVGDEPPETKLYTTLLSIQHETAYPYMTSPLTRVFLPVFDSFNKTTKKPVGLLTALIRWEGFFAGVLPEQLQGIHMVLDNSCDDVYTFMVTGDDPAPVGLGDLHETQYDRFARVASLADVETVKDGSPGGVPLQHQNGQCVYQVTTYPSCYMVDQFHKSLPLLITFAVAGCFAFTFILFIFYDRLVERRQRLVLRRAEQTTAIVQSLFPKSVAEKMIQHRDSLTSSTHTLSKFLSGEDASNSVIADLFPECTVFFGDISGPFSSALVMLRVHNS